jgi:hypothetical protein
MARVFLDEARYQRRRGHTEETSRLAREAYQLFRELGLEEEAGMAHLLIEAR